MRTHHNVDYNKRVSESTTLATFLPRLRRNNDSLVVSTTYSTMKNSPFRYYNKSELEEDGFVLHSSFEGGSSTKDENQRNKENTTPNNVTSSTASNNVMSSTLNSSNKYYVNTIVTIPMKDVDIKAKLDWYTTMTDRTVTAHIVRGKQRQCCSTCGYNTWCYKEMCFSSFDSQGNYEKWCADCMAKEMGGHFVPSVELQEERIKKKNQEECNESSNTSTTSSSSSSSSRDTSGPVVPSSPTRYKPPPGTPKSTPSTPKSTRRLLSLSPASPSSTSCSSNTTAMTTTSLSCHFCQLALERVQSTLCVDDEAIGFQCKDCDSGEKYCLACAHDTGGLFCSGSQCGAFLCQQCNHKYSESPSGHVYCSQECMPPPKQSKMWQLEEESSNNNALDSMALLKKEVMSLLSETTSEVLW